MFSNLIHFAYNPQVPAFSALIREETASLNEGRVLLLIVNFMSRKKIGYGHKERRRMDWLGLRKVDLRIALSRGACDSRLLRHA